MSKQTVTDVLLNRRFGPLEDGCPRERVESEFGEPEEHVAGAPWFVTYGNVEVKYDECRVMGFNIFLERDAQIFLDRDCHIDFEDYLSFEDRLSPVELPEWCRGHSLEFIEDPYISSQNAPRYCLSNGVSVRFRDGTIFAINVEPKADNDFQFLRDDDEADRSG